MADIYSSYNYYLTQLSNGKRIKNWFTGMQNSRPHSKRLLVDKFYNVRRNENSRNVLKYLKLFSYFPLVIWIKQRKALNLIHKLDFAANVSHRLFLCSRTSFKFEILCTCVLIKCGFPVLKLIKNLIRNWRMSSVS